MNKSCLKLFYPHKSGFGIIRTLLLFSVLVFLPAFRAGLASAQPNQTQNEKRIKYKVFFEGLEDENLKDLLEKVSETVAQKEHPTLTEGLLKRRVQDDIPRIRKALRSRGYYESRIETGIDSKDQPVRVVFRIETGPVFRLKKADIKMTGPLREKEPELPGLKKLALEPGMPAEARAILNARSALLRNLKNQGFPLAEADQPEVIVDHQNKTLSVTYPVDPGPSGSFGTTTIKGAVSVETSFILEQLPWQQGEPFQAGLLDKARSKLLKTGLFNVVRFDIPDRLDPHGRVPLTLQLSERQHRTLKLGLGYTTDEGVIGKADWEHRNLFHRGESLQLQGRKSEIGLTLEGTFEKPAFLRPDQSFILSLRLADEYPDAYTSRNITGLVQVKRELGKGMDIALGTALTFSDIEQLGKQENFQLISLPAAFNWDRRDDILDPVRGGNLALKAAPYYDFIGGETSFYKSSIKYSHYIRLLPDPRIILALRGNLGFLGGAALGDIPADIRFYAGGGGTIRGYAYQSVGPLVGDSLDPIGGRSLLTLTSEIRIKITDSIGLVPFLDGGNIFASEYPSFDRDLFWGAGLGFRYFTSIGPLRLDLAFPLNRRESDNPFQIYISLGQAF